MPKLSHLVKRVFGLKTQAKIDGKPCPPALKGWSPVALAYDRRLAAGVFTRRRHRGREAAHLYRIVVWRTYRDRTGTERATTLLHRDEIDPALSLLSKCDERMPHA